MKTLCVIAVIAYSQVCALRLPSPLDIATGAIHRAQNGVQLGFGAAENALNLAHNALIGGDKGADGEKLSLWNPADIGLHIATSAVGAAEDIAEGALGVAESITNGVANRLGHHQGSVSTPVLQVPSVEIPNDVTVEEDVSLTSNEALNDITVEARNVLTWDEALNDITVEASNVPSWNEELNDITVEA